MFHGRYFLIFSSSEYTEKMFSIFSSLEEIEFDFFYISLHWKKSNSIFSIFLFVGRSRIWLFLFFSSLEEVEFVLPCPWTKRYGLNDIQSDRRARFRFCFKRARLKITCFLRVRTNLIFDASALTSGKKIAYEASFPAPHSVATDCIERGCFFSVKLYCIVSFIRIELKRTACTMLKFVSRSN